jgi:hypothetical protein
MRYLILLCVLLGCSTPPAPDNRVAEILSRVQTDNVTQTTVLLDEFGKLNIKLDAVKAAVEAIPAGGDLLPPEPPSSPSKAEPQAPPAFSKPILYVSTIKFCRPCRDLTKDIEKGLFNDFDVRIVDDPDWTEGYPVIRWKEEGEWMYFRDPVTKRNIGYGPGVLQQLKDRLLNDGSI